MLWNSDFSLPPAYSFVATENWVTLLPLARLRISGSRVSRPVSRTLFIGPGLLLRSAGHSRPDPAWSGGIDTAGGFGCRPRRTGPSTGRRVRRGRRCQAGNATLPAGAHRPVIGDSPAAHLGRGHRHGPDGARWSAVHSIRRRVDSSHRREAESPRAFTSAASSHGRQDRRAGPMASPAFR